MTFLISMVPVLELRGAIPIGVAHGLDYRAAIAVSIVGNLVPVPFIVLFIRKIFAWLRTKSERLNAFVTRMEQRALKKSDTVRRARFWGLFLEKHCLQRQLPVKQACHFSQSLVQTL